MSRRLRITAVAALVTIVALGAAAQWRAMSHARASAASIAVVPFLNIAGDSSDEYLADGMADGLATALGKITGAHVVSRSSSYRYKGRRDADAREIGSALAARYVLQGSVRRVAGRLRLSAQLTDARDGKELWSEAYDRPTADAFAVQDEITRIIADTLRSRIGDVAATATRSLASGTSSSGTTNPDAYDLYLRGRFLLQRRGAGVRQATEKFQQAIASDSNFARAYGALAFSVELVAYFEPVNTDSIGRIAILAAHRALVLDSSLAEPHTALALTHWHKYQWRLAEVEHRKAIALDPNDPDGHIQYGRFLHYTGRLKEAQSEFERARQLDPYSAVASGWVGHLLDLRGHTTQGLLELRRALELDSTSPPMLAMTVQALQQAGRIDQAKRIAHALAERVPQWRLGAIALLARLGEQGPAREAIRDIESGHPPFGAWLTSHGAFLYLAIGDSARALDALERATDEGLHWPTNSGLVERQYDILRSNPRFARLVQRLGLDVALFTSATGGRTQ
jgi:serine/threonine-protein kinase